jgi:hypothetical protein
MRPARDRRLAGRVMEARDEHGEAAEWHDRFSAWLRPDSYRVAVTPGGNTTTPAAQDRSDQEL